MKTISVKGETYIKASILARDMGYTSDYIGQLCRSGKVKCEMVGRSWYVEEKSIKAHKGGRYRSSAKKTKEAFKEKLSEVKASHIPVRVETKSNFYSRAHRNAVSYQEDDSELIPSLRPVESVTLKRIDVQLADAQKLEINSPEKAFKIEASSLPELRRKGTLKITDADGAKEATEEDIKSKEKGSVLAVKSDEKTEAVVVHVAPASRRPRAKRRPVSSTQMSKVGSVVRLLLYIVIILAGLFLVATVFLSNQVSVGSDEYISRYEVNTNQSVDLYKKLLEYGSK